jgi:hypothetical protein
MIPMLSLCQHFTKAYTNLLFTNSSTFFASYGMGVRIQSKIPGGIVRSGAMCWGVLCGFVMPWEMSNRVQ